MKRSLSIFACAILTACGGQQIQPLTQQQQQAIVQAACVATVAAEQIHGVDAATSADTATACTAAGTVVSTLPAIVPVPASAPAASK